MNGNYPIIDPRRAKELYQELREILLVALPEWQGDKGDGDYGNALLQIVARLGEHLTRRMDLVPKRDQTEFYRMLDIPADWARPSIAPLVFQLAEKQLSSVFAPARTQTAAATDAGEIIFETQSALQLAPGKIGALLVTDREKDRIEQSPPEFLNLSPPEALQVTHRVVTAAIEGSTILQIEPTEGLEEGDLIRLDDEGLVENNNEQNETVYQISGRKDELFTLREPLATGVKSGASLNKVNQFNIFEMRNQQEHIVYIGHTDLLKLDQSGTITLIFRSKGNLADIFKSGYSWELYAINKEASDYNSDDPQPNWQPLELTSSELIYKYDLKLLGFDAELPEVDKSVLIVKEIEQEGGFSFYINI